MLRYLLFTLLLSVFLTACDGSEIDAAYEPPNPHTGYFSTDYKVQDGEVLINKPLDLSRYDKLLVIGVMTPSYVFASSSEDEQYWQRAIQGLHFFDNVVPVGGLYGFMADNGYGDKVSSQIIDTQDVGKVEEVYGNFLMLEILTSNGLINSVATMKVIDPKTGKIYFMVKRSQAIYLTYSQQLYYPMLNALKNWIDSNSSNIK